MDSRTRQLLYDQQFHLNKKENQLEPLAKSLLWRHFNTENKVGKRTKEFRLQSRP